MTKKITIDLAGVSPPSDRCYAGVDWIAWHLGEIDAWRRGERETPGMPAAGEGYPAHMLDMIKKHEQALIGWGHEPTLAYVRAHGFADGQRGRLA